LVDYGRFKIVAHLKKPNSSWGGDGKQRIPSKRDGRAAKGRTDGNSAFLFLVEGNGWYRVNIYLS